MWVFRKKTITTIIAAFVLLTSLLSLTPTQSAAAQDLGQLSAPVQAGFTIPQNLIPATFAEDSEEVETDEVDCQGGGLSWILCPVIEGIAEASDTIINEFIIPLLQVRPIDLSNTDSNIFVVWSSFRIMANLILVIALLVIVGGQAIGNEYAGAYAAKKTIPRLLVAAILVNISIYLVVAAVDIVNIIGGSISELMLAPFRDNGEFVFNLNGAASTLSILGAIGGIWGLLTAGAGAIQFIMVFLMVPLILAVLGVFATLIIRQGLILLLIIMAPVAFVLYALPNTAQYFKKWWDLFLKTLLVYPIVVVVLTISNILAVTISDSGESPGFFGNGREALSSFVGLVVMIIPLFLIPFAFQLAGGMIGAMAGKFGGWGKRGAEAYKGSEHDPWSRRNMSKRRLRAGFSAGRTKQVNWGKRQQKKEGLIRRGIGRTVSRTVGGSNLEAMDAALNAQTDKMVSDVYSTGGDNFARAFWARKHTGPDDPATGRKAGRYYKAYANADGTYSEVASSDVSMANALAKRDPHMVQAFTKYEMSKAADDGQMSVFKGRFAEKATEAGWTKEQASAVWAGPKFNHQGARLEEKHSDVSEVTQDGQRQIIFDKQRPSRVRPDEQLEYGDVNHDTFSVELADKVRAFDFANLRPGTAKASLEGYQENVEKARLIQEHIDSGSTEALQLDGGTIPPQRLAGALAAASANVQNFKDVATLLRQQQERGGGRIPGLGGEEDEGVAGGIGGSARANQAWGNFVNGVLGPPPPRGGGGTP